MGFLDACNLFSLTTVYLMEARDSPGIISLACGYQKGLSFRMPLPGKRGIFSTT